MIGLQVGRLLRRTVRHRGRLRLARDRLAHRQGPSAPRLPVVQASCGARAGIASSTSPRTSFIGYLDRASGIAEPRSPAPGALGRRVRGLRRHWPAGSAWGSCTAAVCASSRPTWRPTTRTARTSPPGCAQAAVGADGLAGAPPGHRNVGRDYLSRNPLRGRASLWPSGSCRRLLRSARRGGRPLSGFYGGPSIGALTFLTNLTLRSRSCCSPSR